MGSDLIKHAVRLLKRLINTPPDMLVIQVLAVSDTKVSKLSHEDRQSVCQLIYGHMTDALPLPSRGGAYSKSEWRDIRYSWLRFKCAQIAELKDKAEQWKANMMAEIGADLFNRIHRDGFNCQNKIERDIDSMLSCWAYQLAEVGPDSRTPETLKDFLGKVSDYAKRLDTRMQLLSEPWIYRQGVNPDEVYDYLCDTEGYYQLEAILEVAHGVDFGSQHEKDVPSFFELEYNGLKPSDVIKARGIKDEAQRVSRFNWRKSYVADLVELSALLKPVDTCHLPTINRMLNKHGKGFKLVREPARSGKVWRYRINLQNGYYFGVESESYEDALHGIMVEIEELGRCLPGVDINDDDEYQFYKVQRDAAKAAKAIITKGAAA